VHELETTIKAQKSTRGHSRRPHRRMDERSSQTDRKTARVREQRQEHGHVYHTVLAERERRFEAQSDDGE
jgi:hypothetical protein